MKTGSSGYAIWTSTFGGDNTDECYSVSQTPDGGYILGGCTRSYGSGSSDFYLVKADESGNMEWHSTFGAEDNEYCYSASQTSYGGYIMCGSVSVNGCSDIYLVKVDSLGNEEWEATFGGIEQDIARSVQQTSDGGYILAGETASLGAGGSDLYLVKTDASGDLEWDATFGWSMWDRSFSVQQTSDGGYILTGYVCYNGGNRIYLVKTDDSGVMEWETAFGGSNYDYCYSVQQTTDGGYILAGTTESFGAGQNDIWLVKVVPPVEIENESISLIPSEYLIASLAPNPFASSMTISYSLPETGQIELSVYSLSGRLIDCLVSSLTEYGEHQYIWYPSSLESGCYVIRLHAGGRILTETCVHLK